MSKKFFATLIVAVVATFAGYNILLLSDKTRNGIEIEPEIL